MGLKNGGTDVLFRVFFQNKKTKYFQVSVYVNYPYLFPKKIGRSMVFPTPPTFGKSIFSQENTGQYRIDNGGKL